MDKHESLQAIARALTSDNTWARVGAAGIAAFIIDVLDREGFMIVPKEPEEA